MTLLAEYLCNSTTGKRNIDEGSLVRTNKERLKRNYYGILDRFLVEFDRRVTANAVMHNSLESLESSEKFMDITN